MKFKQYENGSCDIEFSWKERLTLLRKGKLHLSDESLKHFGNHLIHTVVQWQIKFSDKLNNIETKKNTEIIPDFKK
jgi:hypothetical protein